MKSLNGIIKQTPVYLNDFEKREDVLLNFHDPYWSDVSKDAVLNEHKNINILFASYGNANYTGDAWVLFEQDGKLYEVSGGHCSCHGLEDQWNPEEVVLKELEHRLLKGTFGEDDWSDNIFKKELCKFLGVEFKENLI